MWVPIKNLFGIAKKRFKPFLEKERVFQVWQEEIGFGKPVFFKDKTLIVKIDNPEIFQELQYNLDKILIKINKRLGEEIVERVRLQSLG